MMAVLFGSQSQESERQDGPRIVPSVDTALAIFETSEIDCARARGARDLLKARTRWKGKVNVQRSVTWPTELDP